MVQPLVALGIFALLLLLKRSLSLRLGKMAPAVYIYAATISFMTSAALSASLWQTSPARFIYITGALLFLLSDGLLAYMYFGPKKVFLLRALNLSFYYAAQLLFALSILFR